MVAKDEVLAGVVRLLAMRQDDPAGFVNEGWATGLAALMDELRRLVGPEAAGRLVDVDA